MNRVNAQMLKWVRRATPLALCLPLLAQAPTAAFAEYPDHVITAVVPFDVGGASDILARIMAAGLSQELGQTVIVVNKPGAAANVGMSFVAHAKPDGYTLLFTATASTQNPAMYRNMPYDPLKDLVGVGEDGEALNVIAVNAAKMPATTLADFIDLLKKNPGKYNAAAGGLTTQLTVDFFALKNNLKIDILPYNSAGDAATALLTGEADFMIVDSSPLIAGIESGKIRPLAVTGDRRLPSLPNVPTAAEAGLTFYEDEQYHSLFAPAGTPDDVLQKLNGALNRVTSRPDVAAQYAKLGWIPVQKTQKDFDAFYHSEIARFKEIVKSANIPPVD